MRYRYPVWDFGPRFGYFKHAQSGRWRVRCGRLGIYHDPGAPIRLHLPRVTEHLVELRVGRAAVILWR